ncbi:unnamed protein product [Notodromas monacha]|uniref:UBP-type domain-containing protein n=1 Tax=Notodromas monacha TaxID=399045 RepID=A0A7R9BUM0_9CRUS|nr:unnamed protein product [Notodromas monacha]CAG0921687.1 unnamed protein product [Notodromas monacha]
MSDHPGSSESRASGDASAVQELVVIGLRDQLGEFGLHAVQPKTDCPHMSLVQAAFEGLVSKEGAVVPEGIKCSNCPDSANAVDNNWICLICYEILCGRDKAEHMMMHSVENGHLTCISFDDLSIWCYACDSYLDHFRPELSPIYQQFHIAKFGSPSPAFPNPNATKI